MRYNNDQALRTPIINRVITLNRKLLYVGRRMPNGRKHSKAREMKELPMPVDIRHQYFDDVLKKGHILFIQAFRQLKGRDYIKRALETIEEIQASCYLVQSLGGMSDITCAEIDLLCQEIASQICAIQEAQKSQHH